MKERCIDGQTIKGSKFLFAMAAAKRSKQINRMAKERGLPPNQVASLKTKFIKSPTLSLVELLDGKIDYFYVPKTKDQESEGELVTEEVSEEVATKVENNDDSTVNL